jgi:hypothetical protein
MKPKSILTAICLVLLLCPIGLAQNPNVAVFTSVGMAIDTDGNSTDVEIFGVATFFTPNSYVIAEGVANKTADIGSGVQDYGISGSVGYVFNNYVTATATLAMAKTETGETSPWYSRVGGSLTFFPKGDLLKETGDKWGLTGAIQYKPGTKQLLFMGMVTTVFGK